MNDENQNAVKLFNDSAELYQYKYMDVQLYASSISKFCAGLKLGDLILDIGCGPGNFLSYLFEHYPDFKLFGTDLSENMIALAKQNVPAGEFSVQDGRNLDFPDTNFHAVLCCFLIPYFNVSEVEDLISKISQLMTQNGRLLFAFIKGEENISEYVNSSKGDPLLMHFYGEEFIRQRLRIYGFELESSEHYVSPNLNQKNIDTFLIARKQ